MTTPDPASLGDALRAAVAAYLAAHPDATVASLARAAGIHEPNLRRALRDGAKARQPTVTALCAAMGLRVALVPVEEARIVTLVTVTVAPNQA